MVLHSFHANSCALYTFIYFTEKLLVLLRDGRKLLGILRSFDQFGTILFSLSFPNVSYTAFFFWFKSIDCSISNSLSTANAVLEGACERVIVGDLYCDIPLGLYVIRGENVVLIGELVST